MEPSYGAGAALYTSIARPDSFYGLLLENPVHLCVRLRDAQGCGECAAVAAADFYWDWDGAASRWKMSTSLRSFFKKQDSTIIDCAWSFRGGEHSETWWGKRLADALRFLFAIR